MSAPPLRVRAGPPHRRTVWDATLDSAPHMNAPHSRGLRAVMRSSASAPARSRPAGPGAALRTTSAASASRSGWVRKRAPSIEEGRNAKMQAPSSTEGMPSIANIHCQPLMPPTPLSDSRPAAIGEPMS
jgi:hypothetical protein